MKSIFRNSTRGVILGLAWLFSIALGSSAADRSPADYVNPLIDTHKSRWFYFSSACRPFGMVSLSPDTSTGGDWMNGYIYGDTKIRCFSHVHCWQLYGIPVLPITGEMRGQFGMDTHASDFSHDDEVVQIHIPLAAKNAVRFKATLGGDYPFGAEGNRRKGFAVRSRGTEERFLTLIEPYENKPMVNSAVALSADKLRVELADGRMQEITIKNPDGDGKNISAEITENKDGQILRRESTG